jgi:hypothetical protein
MAAANRSRAGSINGLWKAPPTGNNNALRAPAAVSFSQAAFTASTSPEITSCPGQIIICGHHNAWRLLTNHFYFLIFQGKHCCPWYLVLNHKLFAWHSHAQSLTLIHLQNSTFGWLLKQKIHRVNVPQPCLV